MAKSTRLTGRNVLSHLGVTPSTPFDFIIKERPPTATDSYNFLIGDIWLDVGTNTPPKVIDIWVLVRLLGPVATWINFTGAGLQTLTGNTGGAVSPDAVNNIDLLGSSGFVVAGNPATNTLTIETSTGQKILESLTGDAGGAVYADAAFNIDLLGTPGSITTTGSPGTNTITIDLDGSVAKQYDTDAGSATPVANALNIFGTSVLNTTGAGNTVSVNVDQGTDGQLIIGGGVDPAWANVTVSGIMQKTEGPNSLNLEAVPLPSTVGFSTGTTTGFTNVTGDGTKYTIIPPVILFNNGSGYDNTTGIFTAPISGYYFLASQVFFLPDNARNGGTASRLLITVNGQEFLGDNLPTHAAVPGFWGPNRNITLTLTGLFFMTAGQTAFVQLQSSGGLKLDSIQAPAVFQQDTCTFYGHLFFAT